MLGIIAKLTIKPGANADFETLHSRVRAGWPEVQVMQEV